MANAAARSLKYSLDTAQGKGDGIKTAGHWYVRRIVAAPLLPIALICCCIALLSLTGTFMEAGMPASTELPPPMLLEGQLSDPPQPSPIIPRRWGDGAPADRVLLLTLSRTFWIAHGHCT